jgi:hypothetical protein
MKIHNLYTDDKGESHFRTPTLPSPAGGGG